MPKNEINPNEIIETPVDDVYFKNLCEIIGKNIRAERRKRKFSIDDLAEYIELSASYVGLLERGDRCPSINSLLKLCELFKITPNELLLKRDYKGTFSVSERKENEHKDYHKAILSLLQTLNESQLKFTSNMIKNLKKVSLDADSVPEKGGESKHEVVSYSKKKK